MTNGPVRPLTIRQQQVAQLVADGWDNKRIAGQLRCSPRRVRQIIGRIAELWELDTGRSYRTQIAQRLARAA